VKDLIKDYQLSLARRRVLGVNLQVNSTKFDKAASREHQDILENRMLRLFESYKE